MTRALPIIERRSMATPKGRVLSYDEYVAKKRMDLYLSKKQKISKEKTTNV